MATSKGRGSNNSKSASKKSAPAKKSTASSGGARGAAAQKKSAAPTKAAAKSAPQKSSGSARGGGATAAKKSTASRNGSSSNAAASRGTQTRGAGNARGAAGSRGAAGKATGGARGAASKRGGKAVSADPRNDLAKILQDLMQDIYYAEKKLSKALGKMAKNASDTRLKDAFTTHQSQTEEQISRLEEAFELIGQKAKAKRCAAMDGLLEEANEHIEEYEKGAGLDAALIVGAQKVEHYEIAAYGSMRSFARTLGYNEAATIFEEIREQESDTDELLTTIAESVVNLKAEDETEDVEGGEKSGSSSRGGRGSKNSDAGEDNSNSDSDDKNSTRGGAGSTGDNDGAGRGTSALTDGNDRGETGEAMGY